MNYLCGLLHSVESDLELMKAEALSPPPLSLIFQVNKVSSVGGLFHVAKQFIVSCHPHPNEREILKKGPGSKFCFSKSCEIEVYNLLSHARFLYSCEPSCTFHHDKDCNVGRLISYG